ncbi:hypothetical protein ACS0TY_008688 [Phlomoides rotata]
MEESVGFSEDSDRLSELPESLILHILSFLPMRDVVSTTLLSKRWENLWTTLPCLNFSHIISGDDELDSNRLRNFVNRALISWKGTKLLKFIIDIEREFDKSLAGDIDFWVRFAAQNKVEELNISLEYPPYEMSWEDTVMGSKTDVYWAPQCLNSCSSIRKLSFVGCNLRIKGYPAWNQLKSLKIDGFCFSERLINRILLGTPQLEVFELRLAESNKNLNIRSTSLKKLKIDKYIYLTEEQPSPDTELRICCPNLETLEISGVLFSKYLFMNVSSLTDASIFMFQCLMVPLGLNCLEKRRGIYFQLSNMLKESNYHLVLLRELFGD